MTDDETLDRDKRLPGFAELMRELDEIEEGPRRRAERSAAVERDLKEIYTLMRAIPDLPVEWPDGTEMTWDERIDPKNWSPERRKAQAAYLRARKRLEWRWDGKPWRRKKDTVHVFRERIPRYKVIEKKPSRPRADRAFLTDPDKKPT